MPVVRGVSYVMTLVPATHVCALPARPEHPIQPSPAPFFFTHS